MSGAIDPNIGWVDDPYVSAQTVPQDTSATGANDPGVFDTGQTINPNSWLGQFLSPAAGSGGGLQGALSTLNKAQNPGGGSEKLGGPSPMNMQGAQGPQGAGIGRSSGAGELATLLQALDARRNLLLQSAVSGQARPVANPASPYAGGATRQTTGLLGI